MKKNRYFIDNDLKRIKKAVKDAEKVTSCEIVPIITESSCSYPESPLLGGFSLLCIVWAVFLILFLNGIYPSFHTFAGSRDILSGGPLYDSRLFFVFCTAVAFFSGAMLVVFIPFVKKICIARKRMTRSVQLSAVKAFFDFECHNTKKRNGVMLYVTLLERRIVILPDIGVKEKFDDPLMWESVINDFIVLLKDGQGGDGFVQAIEESATLLAKKFPPGRKKKQNELSDDVRIVDKNKD